MRIVLAFCIVLFLALVFALVFAARTNAQGASYKSGQVITTGPTLSGTCNPGEVFIKTTATIGVYVCMSANVWASLIGGGVPLSVDTLAGTLSPVLPDNTIVTKLADASRPEAFRVYGKDTGLASTSWGFALSTPDQIGGTFRLQSGRMDGDAEGGPLNIVARAGFGIDTGVVAWGQDNNGSWNGRADRTLKWCNNYIPWNCTSDAGLSYNVANPGVVHISDGTYAGLGQLLTKAVRLDPSGTTKPTCDVTQRGTFWHAYGGASVKDTVEVCAKDAADAYAWRLLY
jgi:hypothetical protein